MNVISSDSDPYSMAFYEFGSLPLSEYGSGSKLFKSSYKL